MSQPLDRSCSLPELGQLDREAGEFWVGNAFMIAQTGENLSAYERNRLYLNVGEDGFIDASFASNVDLDSDTRGAVHADFDRDGKEDIIVSNVGGGPVRLFLNAIEGTGIGFGIQLRDEIKGNISGIGARIIAHTDKRKIYRKHFQENNFMSQGPAETHIGFTKDETLVKVEVLWPDGETQFFNADDLIEWKMNVLRRK